MLNRPPVYQQIRFWMILIPIGLIFLWAYAFYGELSQLYWWFINPNELVARGISEAAFQRSMGILILNLLISPIYLLLSLWMVVQFVLPVKLPSQRWKVFRRLFLFITGGHGPAVFIREGEIQGNIEELQSSRPGVAFVDLTSAIVMERQQFTTSADQSISAREQRERVRMGHGLEPARSTQVSSSMVRAVGPGIVFTEPGERIRGVVSLRNQSRSNPKVRSITRDGFEIEAPVFSSFTLGEDPDVLQVGYIGDRAEDIRVLQVSGKNGQVTGFRDELDEDDKREVHRRYRRAVRFQESPDDIPQPDKQEESGSPYKFDQERVFKAVYADARNLNEDEIVSWLDLPVMVAVEIFRDLISTVRYSDLYLPTEAQAFPLNEVFMPEFRIRVRNQGVLAYQLNVLEDGQPFVEDLQYETNELIKWPAMQFTTSKVLRDRGIKIIAAGTSEIKPVHPAVRQQLFNYWRSLWQREHDMTLAASGYDEVRIRAAARAQAQSSIVKSLSEIITDTSVTEEMIALRIFQALETFAKEPATDKLLPGETTSMLRNLQTWVKPAFEPKITISNPNQALERGSSLDDEGIEPDEVQGS